MFCEKCGTRVDDGQPFCPNCGNRLAEPAASNAPVNPGFNPAPAAAPGKAVPNMGGLLGKLNAMQGLEKLFYPIVLGLWLVCFILSMLHTSKWGISYIQWTPFFGMLTGVLFTLAITFIVLDYFDKFTFKWIWLFNLIAAALILVIFVITWIDMEAKLTAGGWIFFFLQIGLTACSVMLLLSKKK